MQTERIIIALLKDVENKDTKTLVDVRELLKTMLEVQFLLELRTLKVNFSNIRFIGSVLAGHELDVLTAKAICDATIDSI
ncbi:Hypothetical protein FKW44_001573, partial [Caligus rogercresseyi]